MDVTINISIIDIEDEIIRNKIFTKLNECKTLASKVTFELLEDENIKDFSIVKEFIRKVKELNANIAIDDFGSGYSNFERLLDFEPTILKIDGSLIKNILKDSFSRNIVEAMIVFAKKEGLKTVAEFVSSKEIFDLVNELNIDYSQGFYIDKPKALEDIL
jgi:EAL domain-containing protein (putative c-di-GMP-specific phosphodiesterase class I)